jgi:ATP-dependent Clp protease ATP-binding subunit ClpA
MDSFEALVARIDSSAGEDPLERVAAAVMLATELADRADEVMDHFVAQARAAGVSWTDIGARLGVSKQAARKRFTDRVERTAEPVLGEEVSLRPRLQVCLDRAHAIAGGDGAGEVGTEHLLAGLLAEGVAAGVLEKLGVTYEAIHSAAGHLFGPPSPAADAAAPVLSAEAVCAIEGAAHHAQARAVDPDLVEVGTEHLLFVLALDPGSRARRVLSYLGTDIAAIKKELACYVGGNPRRARRRRQARSDLGCSFCGARETPARPFIHGKQAAICRTCVQRAAQSLHDRTSA